MRTLDGRHVVMMFAVGFGIIIAVNLTLAFNAVRTFPGVEVRNSYVASQFYDRDRKAQEALGWDVSAALSQNRLALRILQAGHPIAPTIESAVFGRATSVMSDQTPVFTFDGVSHVATVIGGPGNWNLRLVARAADGTLFRQRVIVESAE